MSTKHSRQRDAILENLRGRYDHPVADELYRDLKQDIPSLSLGTLYRNLALLSSEGIILKLSCGSADRFDGNPNPHYHLVCESCGGVFDLPLEPMPELDVAAESSFDGRVHSHSLTFYGLCSSCSENK